MTTVLYKLSLICFINNLIMLVDYIIYICLTGNAGNIYQLPIVLKLKTNISKAYY